MFGDVAAAFRLIGRIIPAIRELKRGLAKDSAGGKKLTKRERDRVIKKLLPFLEDFVDELEDDIG